MVGPGGLISPLETNPCQHPYPARPLGRAGPRASSLAALGLRFFGFQFGLFLTAYLFYLCLSIFGYYTVAAFCFVYLRPRPLLVFTFLPFLPFSLFGPQPILLIYCYLVGGPTPWFVGGLGFFFSCFFGLPHGLAYYLPPYLSDTMGRSSIYPTWLLYLTISNFTGKFMSSATFIPFNASPDAPPPWTPFSLYDHTEYLSFTAKYAKSVTKGMGRLLAEGEYKRLFRTFCLLSTYRKGSKFGPSGVWDLFTGPIGRLYGIGPDIGILFDDLFLAFSPLPQIQNGIRN